MMGRRYFYRPGHPKASKLGVVDASELDDIVEPDATVPVVTDRYMEGVCATDGTDIGSRKKRREYMRRHGLADADDFKQTWAEAPKKREREAKAGIREQIERAWHQLYKP